MIKTPVRVEGVSIIDADGEIVIQSMAQFTQTGNVAVANEIAAALNGPKEGTFEWAVKQLESGNTVKSNDLYLKIVNGVLFASIDEGEPWTCACITWEIIKRNNWRKAVE